MSSLSVYATSFAGIGGAFTLAKGVKDFINPEIIDKRIAKAEIVAGSILLTYTALNIVFLNDGPFSSYKKTIIVNEEDFLGNKKFLIDSNSYIQTVISSIFIGAFIPVVCTTGLGCCVICSKCCSC